MPVIVVGADTRIGMEVVDGLRGRDGEVRAFVSDPEAGTALKARGIKTAIGDVSDGSHVGAAACGCFGAVLVTTAADDGRERAFAGSAEEVLEAWAEGLADAEVRRAIWVLPEGAALPARPHAVEVARIDASLPASVIAAEVRRLDDLAEL